MADKDKKLSIFEQIKSLTSVQLDAQIAKAENLIKSMNRKSTESDFNFGKAVTRDRTYYMGSQGFQEKPGAISFEHLRHTAIKSSVISAIIKTRQNQVAAFSELIEDSNEKGFKIVLKNEKEALEEIKQELFPEEKEVAESSEILSEGEDKESKEARSSEQASEIKKSEDLDSEPQEKLTDAEKDHIAREELERRTRKKRQAIGEFLSNCGELKDRPFESKRWSFDAFLRAIVWDSLIYDQIAVERVPKDAAELKGKLNMHHFIPMDASTVRYASPELRKYKDNDLNAGQDILYPEEELKHLEETDALDLDEDRLENNEYKYVQVIRGRIHRAFTEEELAFGIRNPVTDLYANGYSIPELEILVALVTSHLNTEYYNRAYFQQGFSAKGILHVKANLNRSKLEELRRHWNNLVKGNRNSFQTPIMSGMEEIQWIPLTQNHNEMEFNLWLEYLIRMICSIYQIDPSEIGYGMKDAGGAGMSGDNTQEKLQQSKDKGFVPLMRFLADFVNKNIIDYLDPDYCLEWVGLREESTEEILFRQEIEVKIKKTLNEIRAEDGLPPIKGADFILDTNFMQWFMATNENVRDLQQEDQERQMEQEQAMMDAQGADQEVNPEDSQELSPEDQHELEQEAADAEHERTLATKEKEAELEKDVYSHKVKEDKKKPKEKVEKSLRIEYYRLDDDTL